MSEVLARGASISTMSCATSARPVLKNSSRSQPGSSSARVRIDPSASRWPSAFQCLPEAPPGRSRLHFEHPAPGQPRRRPTNLCDHGSVGLETEASRHSAARPLLGLRLSGNDSTIDCGAIHWLSGSLHTVFSFGGHAGLCDRLS